MCPWHFDHTPVEAMSLDPLDIDRLLRHTFVARTEHHAVLGSTNDVAGQRTAEGSISLPLLVVADDQTAGRGRAAHRWWTGKGSLACSLLLDPTEYRIDRTRSPLVSLATALAVVDAVAPLLSSHRVGIHWPNDVFADRRKLAGILVETLGTGLQIIGIGLNTNNTIDDAPPELRPAAVTLRDLTGARHDPTSILVTLLQHLERWLRQLADSPTAVAARADACCLQHGQMLAVDRGTQRVVGQCAGIAPDGALLLETDSGPQSVYSGVVRAQPD